MSAVCHRCGAPMPAWFCVLLCDPCLDKALGETPERGEAVIVGEEPGRG